MSVRASIYRQKDLKIRVGKQMLQKTFVINSSQLVFTDQQFCTSVSGSRFKMKNPFRNEKKKS